MRANRPQYNSVKWAPMMLVLALAEPALAQTSGPFSISDTTLPAGTGRRVVSELLDQDALADALGPALETSMNTTLGTLSTNLTNEINTRLNQLNFVPFLRSMANAGVIAARGIPVDYATNPDIFTLSVGGGVGAQNLSGIADIISGGFNAESEVPAVGVSASASLVLGINFAAFMKPKDSLLDLSRLSLYFSGSYLPVPASIDQVQGSYISGAVHGAYKLVRPVKILPAGMLKWGGVDVISGVGYSSMDFSVKMKLPEGSQEQLVDVGNSGQQVTTRLSWSGDAKVGANIGVVSIPIEVSTSLQLLYVLSLYAGGGVDFNFGTSKVGVSADAPVQISAINPTDNSELKLSNPTASLSFAQASRPTVVDGRAFVGVQINIPVVKIFVQGSYASTQSLGAHAGLRIAW